MNLLPAYEVWAWIRGYEGRYEISNRGRIRSWVVKGGGSIKNKGKIRYSPTPKVKRAHANKHGYEQVGVGNGCMEDYRLARTHREVATAFIPNPLNLPEVNHINGDKGCNEWWNFEWVDRIGSIEHAFRTGLIKPALGEAQSNTKLTNEQVLEIYKSKDKTSVASKKFGISTHAILDIRRGRTWWHLTGHKRHIKPCEAGKFKSII